MKQTLKGWNLRLIATSLLNVGSADVRVQANGHEAGSPGARGDGTSSVKSAAPELAEAEWGALLRGDGKGGQSPLTSRRTGALNIG